MAREKGRQDAASGIRKGDTARAERLRLALRENLRRRKVQAKERSAGRPPSHDSAGFVPDKSGR